jgi:tRNA G10  N-methylase Trm11
MVFPPPHCKPAYAAVLGRLPRLGFAELKAITEERGKIYLQRTPLKRVVWLCKANAKPPFPSPAAAQIFLDRLGGTIKLVRLRGKLKAEHQIKHYNPLLSILRHKYEKKDLPQTLGLSLYGHWRIWRPRQWASEAKRQKLLRRFVLPRRGTALTSAQTFGNHLASPPHCELVFFSLSPTAPQVIYWGEVTAVQNIASYARRDRARPRFDASVGMLPPKLAQIMLNLAKLPRGAHVFDPFCGFGTILQEALLQGHAVSGSDLDPQRVEDTKENLNWLVQNFSPALKMSGGIKTLRVHNAQKPFGFLKKQSVDAVVTEGYLGPPLRSRLTFSEAINFFRRAKSLWEALLRNSHRVLRQEGRVVFTAPRFPLRDRKAKTVGLRSLDELGRGMYFIRYGVGAKQRLTYSRPHQAVWRDIIVLEKISSYP